MASLVEYNIQAAEIRRTTSGGTVVSSDYKSTAAHDYFGDSCVANDAYYISEYHPFGAIKFTVGTAFSASAVTFAWEYWNGSAWTAVSNLNDGTSDFSVTGVVSFDVPSNWMPVKPSGFTYSRYIVRCRIASVTTPTEGGASSYPTRSNSYSYILTTPKTMLASADYSGSTTLTTFDEVPNTTYGQHLGFDITSFTSLSTQITITGTSFEGETSETFTLLNGTFISGTGKYTSYYKWKTVTSITFNGTLSFSIELCESFDTIFDESETNGWNIKRLGVMGSSILFDKYTSEANVNAGTYLGLRLGNTWFKDYYKSVTFEDRHFMENTSGGFIQLGQKALSLDATRSVGYGGGQFIFNNRAQGSMACCLNVFFYNPYFYGTSMSFPMYEVTDGNLHHWLRFEGTGEVIDSNIERYRTINSQPDIKWERSVVGFGFYGVLEGFSPLYSSELVAAGTGMWNTAYGLRKIMKPNIINVGALNTRGTNATSSQGGLVEWVDAKPVFSPLIGNDVLSYPASRAHLYELYTMNLKVVDERGNAIEGAEITITDVNGKSAIYMGDLLSGKTPTSNYTVTNPTFCTIDYAHSLSTTGSSGVDQYLEFDLGEEADVSNIIVRNQGGLVADGATKYPNVSGNLWFTAYGADIDYSTDGENWTNYYSGDVLQKAEGTEHRLSTRIRARYLRFWMNGNSLNTTNYWNNIQTISFKPSVQSDYEGEASPIAAYKWAHYEEGAERTTSPTYDILYPITIKVTKSGYKSETVVIEDAGTKDMAITLEKVKNLNLSNSVRIQNQ